MEKNLIIWYYQKAKRLYFLNFCLVLPAILLLLWKAKKAVYLHSKNRWRIRPADLLRLIIYLRYPFGASTLWSWHFSVRLKFSLRISKERVPSTWKTYGGKPSSFPQEKLLPSTKSPCKNRLHRVEISRWTPLYPERKKPGYRMNEFNQNSFHKS